VIEENKARIRQFLPLRIDKSITEIRVTNRIGSSDLGSAAGARLSASSLGGMMTRSPGPLGRRPSSEARLKSLDRLGPDQRDRKASCRFAL
jgi:hypothetical protein